MTLGGTLTRPAPEPATIATEGADKRTFRADIQGLRAVAVLLVMIWHAGVTGLPGGFVGVDVFFVISGFLMTGILLRELPARHRWRRMVDFYGRRARRLLPASLFVLVVAGAIGWFVTPATRTSRNRYVAPRGPSATSTPSSTAA